MRRASLSAIVLLATSSALPAGATLAATRTKTPSKEASGAASKGATMTARSGDTGWTGILDEKRFKALHQLKTGAVPELHGTMIDLAGGKAYLSLPPGGRAPLPGVIVIHEWWGLNDNVKHWSDRLAADGFAALAVDLYRGKAATTPDEAMALMKSVDEARSLASLHAAHDFLVHDPRVTAPRTATIGWCFGGHWSLRAAIAEPDLDAAVIYYGRLLTTPEDLKPIHASLLGIFGNEDESIPPATVDAFDKALGEAGVEHRILRYDARHAFANPSGANYEEAAAAAAWKEARAFLESHLRPPRQ